MQTATYIHEPTREAVRARSLAYIECDVPPGLTLDEHRRGLRPRRAGGGAARRALRVAARAALRYPDDPTGDYETTDGGW